MIKIITAFVLGTLVFAGCNDLSTEADASMTWRQFKKLPQAKCIRKRESGGNHRIVSSNGLWHGLYQFYTPTWQKMGGTKYAPVASQATRKQQHKIAFKTWKRVGWSPWYHATKPCY